jgi:flagellar motor switch protein FliG
VSALLSPSGAGAPAVALTGAQRAAAVLLAIGNDASAKVLAHLGPTEVEELALEIATLGPVPAEQMERILTEFHAEAVAHQTLVAGGEMQAREMLRAIHGNRADEIVDRLLATVQTQPFHFLRMHDPAVVAQHLRDEHPQTVALILAHLPAKFAAAILSGLAPEVQGEVARRVATLDPTARETVERIEQALKERFGGVARHDSRHGGVADLAALLNQVDRSVERAILGSLEETNPELADEVRALMFVFEDIVLLDDRAVQEVLRQVDTAKLALALKGVPAEVQACIERNLSERGRESLAEEVELLGAVRVRDVETAQTEVVRRIRALEADGTIVINRGGEGEFVE